MGALILRPLPMTVLSATNADALTPKENLASDKAGLSFRNTGSSSVVTLDLGATGLAYDTVAILGLPNALTGTFKVQVANVSDFSVMLGDYSAVTIPTGGTQPTKMGIYTGAMPAARYVRVTFASTTGLEVFRIVVGSAINTPIHYNAERGWEDQSEMTAATAYQSFAEYPTVGTWKVDTTILSDVEARTIWQPFFRNVGVSKPFLFIPQYDDATTWQHDWTYGRLQQQPVMVSRSFDYWIIQMKVRAVF